MGGHEIGRDFSFPRQEPRSPPILNPSQILSSSRHVYVLCSWAWTRRLHKQKIKRETNYTAINVPKSSERSDSVGESTLPPDDIAKLPAETGVFEAARNRSAGNRASFSMMPLKFLPFHFRQTDSCHDISQSPSRGLILE